MFNKIKSSFNFIKNMGWRYVSFRTRYEIARRTGALKRKFPTNVDIHSYFTLKQWKGNGGEFFFESKQALSFPKKPEYALADRFQAYLDGNLLFFNSVEYNIGRDYDWFTNPDTGFKFDVHKHWTEIADYSGEAGDIKFVWEKSRFSFLYDIIRYDYHFEKDCSQIVFDEIISWINSNPVNKGPNYRCSQEISLRVLNWIFALYYYKNSPVLTDAVFDKMQHAIYWQMHHVYHNINFSRIAVRNNHAITETLTLYLMHLIFPFVPQFAEWGADGKKWFEQEIDYQIYNDGTFLQFSMNYHRVVVQLLTWGIKLAEANKQSFTKLVYEKAFKSLYFLRVCMDETSGHLPNYGSNDGALFFKLNNAHYRDYRPQLQALANALKTDVALGDILADDVYWYGSLKDPQQQISITSGTYAFKHGGYYVIKDNGSLLFIRCGSHKDRPLQADNLHLDLWHNGENILIDAGSFKYNTDSIALKYFMGTQSHNTVILNDHDQMLKGPRFIWYNWTQSIDADVNEESENFIFDGTISTFRYINKNIRHRRRIIKKKGELELKIIDSISDVPAGYSPKQLWHMLEGQSELLEIVANDDSGVIQANESIAWYSGVYGQKQIAKQVSFTFKSATITTSIKLKRE